MCLNSSVWVPCESHMLQIHNSHLCAKASYVNFSHTLQQVIFGFHLQCLISPGYRIINCNIEDDIFCFSIFSSSFARAFNFFRSAHSIGLDQICTLLIPRGTCIWSSSKRIYNIYNTIKWNSSAGHITFKNLNNKGNAYVKTKVSTVYLVYCCCCCVF